MITTNLWILLDMFIAAMCLYQAGKFATVMDINCIEERKTKIHMQVLYWLNLFFGLYLLIVIYGKGIERGSMI